MGQQQDSVKAARGKLNGLDLFSGIGGLTLALSSWVEPIAYCENDKYAQAVLFTRMREGVLPRAPIWDDVRTLNASDIPIVDIIYGGFPCQDISCAGNGKGLGGERSGLFFEIARIAKETGAPFVFLENVPAIRTRGLRDVIRTLTDLRYDCRWTRLSAASVGAPHLRERWFLLAANSECFELRHEQGRSCRTNWKRETELRDNGKEKSLERRSLGNSQRANANSGSVRFSDREQNSGGESLSAELERSSKIFDGSYWSIEPNVGRVANGVPVRMDRVRGLGNAVVPLQARVAFERLLGIGGDQ